MVATHVDGAHARGRRGVTRDIMVMVVVVVVEDAVRVVHGHVGVCVVGRHNKDDDGDDRGKENGDEEADDHGGEVRRVTVLGATDARPRFSVRLHAAALGIWQRRPAP